jgi:hypothetical protein
MDATAEDLFMAARTREITKDQLAMLFRQAFESHTKKLALIADFGRQTPAIDPAVEADDEQAMGWAYRLLAKKGLGARLGDDDVRAMKDAGLTDPAIGGVETTLAAMQRTGQARPSLVSGVLRPQP